MITRKEASMPAKNSSRFTRVASYFLTLLLLFTISHNARAAFPEASPIKAV
jgi:uncharacterized membrane protein